MEPEFGLYFRTLGLSRWPTKTARTIEGGSVQQSVSYISLPRIHHFCGPPLWLSCVVEFLKHGYHQSSVSRSFPTQEHVLIQTKQTWRINRQNYLANCDDHGMFKYFIFACLSRRNAASLSAHLQMEFIAYLVRFKYFSHGNVWSRSLACILEH